MQCHLAEVNSKYSLLKFKERGFLKNIDKAQLSPEIFDPRKMDPNFLEDNFEYFRLSTARDDEN